MIFIYELVDIVWSTTLIFWKIVLKYTSSKKIFHFILLELYQKLYRLKLNDSFNQILRLRYCNVNSNVDFCFDSLKKQVKFKLNGWFLSTFGNRIYKCQVAIFILNFIVSVKIVVIKIKILITCLYVLSTTYII